MAIRAEIVLVGVNTFPLDYVSEEEGHRISHARDAKPDNDLRSIQIREMPKMNEKSQDMPAILRRRQVEQRTGLARSTIYQYIADGAFPKPVRLGPLAVGWLASDIRDWIAARVQCARRRDTTAR